VDRRAIDADTIRRIASDTPGVEAATDIRSRGRPGEAFAELTIKVHPGTNVREAHEIADAVEERLRKGEGFYGVVVHVEPRAD
jgi:divalent metal cation (Fe/Co/Zn/Cd) transporter